MIIRHSAGEYPISFAPLSLPDGIIVTDSNVANALGHHLQERDPIILPPGEQTKSLESYGNLCRELVKKRATRKSVLVALGGGVIGDLVGFAAATYMRGIPYIQIPTTLLSQVDSSVGGKTGIDLPEGKNLVGAFHPPSNVLIDTDILKTLPLRQFQCGMAEVIKAGLIRSKPLADSLYSQPLAPSDTRLQQVVQECVEIKAYVVENDEFETTGLRAQLNFGHTVGHALEQMTGYEKYTHGEAIAVGMAVEARIGELMGLHNAEVTEQVKRLMISHGLPVNAEELSNVDQVLATIRKDKKSMQGEVSMSLLEGIGTCALHTNLDEDLVRKALGEYG